ncbi:MAG TPA: AEC family transporter [Anaerolineales bacterium]|nr:AEC family transporter [Anaerolineales bacterium]
MIDLHYLLDLVNLFLNNLLPIILITGFGYALGHLAKTSPRPLSQVIFYILTPVLVFKLLTHSQLNGEDILRTVGLAVLLTLTIGLLTWASGRALRIEGRLMNAVLLITMFMNAGNFGLPLTMFAFGEDALAYAGLFFVTTLTLTNTLGVLIASSGTRSLPQALLELLKLPATYSLALGLIFLQFKWQLPTAVERTVVLVADAAIPSMLVLLGLQLHTVRWDGQLKALGLASAMRLLVAPLFAIGLSRWIGLNGPAYQAVVLESAMPAAVMTTVLATEFDTEPAFVTTVVLVTTLLSPLTLTPLLALLGA